MKWLQHFAKDLLTPRLVLVEQLAGCGGFFWAPEKKEVFFDGTYHPLDRGILVVLEAPDSATVSNAIAHEWRHYWQWFNRAHWAARAFRTDQPYKKEILRFFRSPMELDALIFSHKVAPCEVSEIWLRWLDEKNR